ncbi:MAG: SusD/RagB family nutrient-binding outer membrane lipoprotein [Prevotellaceae bacterium]|jgi:hypothetical protein|nr:SusD/RagB family nutrient-binding outer membrane lipoprotein [Prevotellaceae bacterium]
MKSIFNKFAISVLCILLAGCDFDEINTNPNAPTTATPGMLAAGQIGNMLMKERNGKGYFYDHMVSKHISWGEGRVEDYQYNNLGRWGFGVYTNLTNAQKMVEIADELDKDAYTGLFLLIKASCLFELSLGVGDIPYSDALKALEGITSPKYDTQKEVMLQILDDLDAAYTHFGKATQPFDGDISHFAGDPVKWQRSVSMLQLKVLINLSKKESDPDLNVKGRFAEIVANRQLQLSNDDNLQLTYGEQASNEYALYRISDRNRDYMYPDMTTPVMNPLKQYEDRRLFSFAEPCKAKVDAGVAENKWDAYGCVDPSLRYTEEIIPYRSDGNVSLINNRFFEIQSGQPTIKHGYAEQNFILAEARLRGWITTGDANEYYKEGIRASMKFNAQYTPTAYSHDMPITDEWIEEFLQKFELQLNTSAGLSPENLEKIITQKYLAAFMHDTYNSYFEYRRTGYPVLPINPESNRNTDPTKMPVRWMYSESEYQYNRENVLEAVQRQFGGNDDVNELMWILKE